MAPSAGSSHTPHDRRPWRGVAILGLLAGLFAWLVGGVLRDEAPPSPAASPAAVDPAAVAPAAVPAAPPAAGAAAPAEAERLPAAPDVQVAIAPAVEFRGRCLAAAGGAPLPGASVEAADAERAGRHEAWAADLVLARTTTEADGTFRLRVPCTASAHLRAGAAGHAPLTARLEAGSPGEIDVGDIRLVRAVAVAGDVVDDQGNPIEDASVVIAILRDEPPTALPRRVHTATTDVRGRFTMPAPLYPDDWYVVVHRAGPFVGPRQITVPADVDHHELRLTVGRADPASTITGKVVGADGVPLAGIELHASGDGAQGTARSRVDGTFRLAKAGPVMDGGQPGVRLSITDPQRAHEVEQPAPGASLRWGQGGVAVQLRRLTSTTLRVTAGGEAVPDYDAFVLRDDGELVKCTLASARGAEDGCSAVDGLHRGNHRVLVRPLQPQLPHSTLAPFVVTSDRTPVEVAIAVAPPTPVVVELVTEAGAGSPGSAVEAILVLAGKPPRATTVVPPFATMSPRDLLRQASLAVAVGTTDADGRATLALAPGTYTLRLRGRGHTPVLQELVVGSAPLTVRVVATAAGWVLGELAPPAAFARWRELAGRVRDQIAVVAVPPTGGATAAVRALVDAAGTFTLPGLAAGTYTLFLNGTWNCNPDHTGVVHLPLGSLDVAPGEHRRTFDVQPLLPGTVDFTVTIDGQPWPLAQLLLVGTRPPQGAVRATADAQGRVRTLLPPGEFRPSVSFAAMPGPGWITVPQPDLVTMATGAERSVLVAARTRSLTLRVADAAGAPVPRARVRLQAGVGYFRPGTLTTDDAGHVVVPHPPFGPFDVLVQAGAGTELRCGPAELDPLQTAGAVDVRPRQ